MRSPAGVFSAALSDATLEKHLSFDCGSSNNNSIVYQPRGAAVRAVTAAEGRCTLANVSSLFVRASAARPMLLQNAHADVVVRAGNGTLLLYQFINPASPVRNQGQNVLFDDIINLAESAGSAGSAGSAKGANHGLASSRAFYAAWNASRCSQTPAAGPCKLETVPWSARTFNFFRAPLSLSVNTTASGADLFVGFRATLRAEVDSTRWHIPPHYLPLLPSPLLTTENPSAARLGVQLADGKASVVVQSLHGGKQRLLAQVSLPRSCSGAPAQVTLLADVFNVSATVVCGASSVSSHVVQHALDWQQGGGFGDAVGEAVLQLVSSWPAIEKAPVHVVNTGQPPAAPAVLSPVTDQVGSARAGSADWALAVQTGTLSWDIGTTGVYSLDTLGVLDITDSPFFVVPSGAEDVTDALQAAIDFSRYNYLALHLPAGVYPVQEPLRAYQQPRYAAGGALAFNASSNYCWSRFSTFRIYGETTVSDAKLPIHGGDDYSPRQGRATLLLRPSTPAFAMQDSPYTFAVLNVSNINAEGRLQPNILMSAVVQSLDVIIHSGNPLATGIAMRGAQGSSLEDVYVRAAPDAFAGVLGLSGSGGAHSNITVVGARFGIDGRKTQPAPTLSNVRLYNQSCVSLLHVGFGPLVIAGMHIVVGSASAGHTAPAYLSGTPDLLPLPDVPECALLATGDGQKTSEELAGASSLIDVVLECDGGACAKRAALRSFRSMYLRNVVVARGFAQVLDLKAFDGNATVFSLAPSDAAYTSCSEVAAAVPIPGAGEAPVTVSIIVNNQTKSLPAGVIDVSPLALRPDVCTLLDKHGWGDNLRYPSLAQSSLVNVLDFGAQADGSRASSRQIQAAIDAAATRVSPRERTVFMPRGVYRVNESLVVPGNVSLLGVARHLTLLVADASVVERSGGDRRESGHPLTSGAREPAAGAPLVRLSVAEDTQETGTSSPVLQAALAQLMMTVPLNTTRGAHAWAFSAPADRVPARTGRAVSGGSGFLSTRQLWQTRVAACGSWFYNARCVERFFGRLPDPYSQAVLSGPLPEVRLHVFFQEDGPRNGGGADSPDGRKLLVLNTTRPLRIYPLNGEHGSYGAYSEFRYAAGPVEVFGCKSESAGPVIWARECEDFASYGHGGLAAAVDERPSNFPHFHDFPLSLYRAQGGRRVRFVNIQSMKYHGAGETGTFPAFADIVSPTGGFNYTSPNGTLPMLYMRSP